MDGRPENIMPLPCIVGEGMKITYSSQHVRNGLSSKEFTVLKIYANYYCTDFRTHFDGR